MTPGGHPGRLAAAVGTVAALAAVLAGCTSGGGGTDTSSSAPPSSSTAPTTTSPTTSDTPTPTTTPTGSPTATGTPTVSPPPTGSSGPPALAACTDLGVTVTRVPGGGGVTYGLISVTNRGDRCTLPGVPSIRLLDAAKAPMTPTATPDGATSGALALDGGATASTLLEDRSANCQANTRSTYVEVQPTTAAPTTLAALSLPPCSLSVKPFVPGTSPAP